MTEETICLSCILESCNEDDPQCFYSIWVKDSGRQKVEARRERTLATIATRKPRRTKEQIALDAKRKRQSTACRKWRKANPAKQAASTRKWIDANRERVNELNRASRKRTYFVGKFAGRNREIREVQG